MSRRCLRSGFLALLAADDDVLFRIERGLGWVTLNRSHSTRCIARRTGSHAL